MMRPHRLPLAACAMFAAATSVASQAPDNAALPDRAAFLASVRAHLFTDEQAQRDYTYLERREEIRVSKLGKVEVGRVCTFEVYASPLPGQQYRRLVADNDVPLSAEELRRRDERYAKFLRDLEQTRARETPGDRARREGREAAERRKRDELVDDVFRTYEMRLLRRERVTGHDTIVVSLTPRPNVATRSDAGKYFKKFRGTAWVSEPDRQVVKLDLESTESVLIGWGLAGRISPGSRLVFERRFVNGEVWLPFRSQIDIKGRALLFRRFDVSAVTEYSDYRKFTVRTREELSPPAGR